MLLPGCDRCGQCGCVCGKLPYTLTVEFSGLVNRTHSIYCPLTITSNFGCGAVAVATAPGGCDDDEPECGPSDRGPLSGVVVVEPGHDYARRGRVEPTLTISGGSGSGATFTPTLAAVDGTLAESCRSYGLASVAVSGGTGYAEGEALTIASDGVAVTPAVAIIHVGRSEPTVTASVEGGSGATFSVTLASNGNDTWGVAAISITNGGSGYPFDCGESGEWTSLPVTFSVAAGETIVAAATATAYPEIAEPIGYDEIQTNFGSGGSGFAGTLAYTPTADAYGRPAYTVSGITITDGGSGYAVDDYLAIINFAGQCGTVEFTVTSVDGSGAITGLSAPNVIWLFGRFTGAIASVTLNTAGAYYATGGGTPNSVEVTTPGEYYKEDADAAICVATVNVTAEGCGDGGTGAELSAVIDSDPESATYGQITGINIDDGGDGYLLWRWACTNQSEINGEPIVLVAENPTRLVTLAVEACHGSGACLRVVPKGDGTTCDPATDVLYDGGPAPIREVEVVNGGSNYATYGREEPQWVASIYGWTFTPTFGEAFEDACGRALWGVESFAITNSGGTGSALDGWSLSGAWSVATALEKRDEIYYAVVRTREEPEVTATAATDGDAAQFSVTVEEVQAGAQPRAWRVASVSVTSGGTGYSKTTPVIFAVPVRDGSYGHYTGSPAMATANANDAGAIISVTVTSGGEYWLDNGVPQSVEMLRDENDEIRGGKYYRENPALTPYVATPTVVITQLPPSAGSGAVIGVTVGSDTSNASTFGKILTATVTTQGGGYTLLGGPTNCIYSADYLGCDSLAIEFQLRGNGKAPDLFLGSTVLRCDQPLGDCDDLPTTASLLYGAAAGVTATITRGGSVPTPCSAPSWCAQDNNLICPTDGSLCPEVLPFTLVCDGNAGQCIPGGENVNGLYPPYWAAQGATEFVPFDPEYGALLKSNNAFLYCYNRFMFINGECVFVEWAVLASRVVTCHPISSDFFTIASYYALVDSDEDGWPVAGEVTLIEGQMTASGGPFLGFGCPDGPGTNNPFCCCSDCGQQLLESISVSITRP